MAKKSALEEARDFLGGVISNAGSKISSFAQDYKNYALNLRQQELDRQARLKSFVSNPIQHFNPENTSGFWTSPTAQALGQYQKGIEWASQKIPRFNFAEKVAEQQSTPLKKFGVGVALGIPQSILNTPSLLVRGSTETGQAINQRRPLTEILAKAVQPAEGILNIATFGGVGSLAKGIGEQGFKQAVKEGALMGGKYGLAYGGLSGIERNAQAENVGQQILRSVPDMVTGGLAGAVLGGGVSGVTYTVSPLVSKYITPAIRKLFLQDAEMGSSFTPSQFVQRVSQGGNEVWTKWAQSVAQIAESQGVNIKVGAQGVRPTKLGQFVGLGGRGNLTFEFIPKPGELPGMAGLPMPEAPLALTAGQAQGQIAAGGPGEITPVIPTKAIELPAPRPAPQELATPAITKAINLSESIQSLSPKVQEVVNGLLPVPDTIPVGEVKLYSGSKFMVPEDMILKLSKQITALENETTRYTQAGMDVPSNITSEISSLYKQVSGQEKVPGISQDTVSAFDKKFGLTAEQQKVQTSPFADLVPTTETPGVKTEEVPFDQTETFQTTLRMLDEFRRVNSEIPDIFAPTGAAEKKAPILSDEELARRALDNFRGYTPNQEPGIKYTPETEARFQELASYKTDFLKQIGEVEDALRNYDFYKQRFGEMLGKGELKSLKSDLVKSVKQIDAEATDLQKTGEPIMVITSSEPAPGNDELAMEALKNWRDGVPPIEKSPAEALVDTKEAPVEVKAAKGAEGKLPEVQKTKPVSETQVDVMDEKPQRTIDQSIHEANVANNRPPEFDRAQKEMFNNIFAKFIGERDVAKTTGIQIGEKFVSIPKELGPEIIRARENPDLPMSPEVAQWIKPIAEEYDRLYQDAVDAGVNIHYLNDYITHIWEQSPEEVAKAYMAAKTKFNFAGERLIPTYDEGILMGLKPRFTHPAQIIAHYTERLEQTKANVELMSNLRAAGLVLPAGEGARYPGWAPISAPGINRSVSTTTIGKKKTQVIGDYYAPREIANVLNKVFSPDERGFVGNLVGGTAKLSGLLQDITLSGGLPYTPLNAYTFGQTIKEVTAGVGGLWNSPIYSAKRMLSPVTSVLQSILPGASERFFKANTDQIKKMQARNIPVSTDYNVDNLISQNLLEKVIGKDLRTTWNKAINNPTFKEFMPMLQINMFNDIEKMALKNKYAPEQAANIAADAVKSFYGVVGSDDIARRDRAVHDAITTFFFAPKYRESMIRMWWTAAKSASPIQIEHEGIKPTGVHLNNPFSLTNKTSTNFLIGTLLTIVGYNLANLALNGRMMSENPEGQQDKLLVPIGDYTMGIPVLPSVATVPRAIISSIDNLLRGDIPGVLKQSKNYLSSLFAPLVDVASNENYFGQPIYEENDTPEQRYAKMGKYLAGAYNHPWIEAAMDHYSKGEPGYVTLSKALELPLRWYKTDSISSRYYFDNLDTARRTLSPEAQRAWDKMHPKNKAMFTDEDGLPVDDTRSSMANALDRLAYPEIVQAETDAALRTAQQTGEPLNPFYTLDSQQQMTVLMLKTFYPGEETKKTIQNQNLEWLKPYWNARDAWYTDMENRGIIGNKSTDQITQSRQSAVYGLMDQGITSTKEITGILNDAAIRSGYSTGDFSEDEVNKYIVDRGFIKASPEMQKKLDYYNTLPKGTGARSRYLRANPDVVSFFDAQSQLTNDKRIELGLPPTTGFGSGSSGWGSAPKKPKIKVGAAKGPTKLKLTGSTKSTIKPLKLASLSKGISTRPGSRATGTFKGATTRSYKPKAVSLKIKAPSIKI